MTEVAGKEKVVVAGVIERILFHNDANAYIVFKMRPDPGFDVRFDSTGKFVTCVGSLIEPSPFAHLRLSGSWIKHPRYGEQFSFTHSEEILPTSLDGIRRYLSSGIIKGLSKTLTERILKKFGQETLTILDHEPSRLLEVDGIGKKNIRKVKQSWAEHTSIRDLVLFLQPYDISVSLCARILSVFGEDALQIIRHNPYCLCTKINGISFERADAMALDMGFENNSPMRLKACIINSLKQASFNGHVYIKSESVRELLSQLKPFEDKQDGNRRASGLTDEEFLHLLKELTEDDAIVCDRFDKNKMQTVSSSTSYTMAHEWDPQASDSNLHSLVYLKRLYEAETKTTSQILRLLCSPKSISFPNIEEMADEAIQEQAKVLAPEQREAVIMAAESKMLVITGGPGTGKTTIIKTIISLFAKQKARIFLAAPTGRAARRMQEATGFPAKTIHRLLGFTDTEGDCNRNELNPLVCDVLIVDEASMMDILIFQRLLMAIPLGCTVIIVGDISQLPSVGPGSVLSDIIQSGTVAVVKLTRIFRQSQQSAIVRYAHSINEGVVPDLMHDTENKDDFYFIEESNPEKAADLICDLVVRRLPNYYHFPSSDIQVLSPMRKGEIGVHILNQKLQDALNPNGFAVKRMNGTFRLGDRVMQIRNDYEKEVFNGDIGSISEIRAEDRILKVDFDESSVEYDFNEIDDLVVAYAISIHKSQGSEYPAVIIPCMTCHWWMLQRNLLYTAITRGKKLVVLVGERRAFIRAIEHTDSSSRRTLLKERLKKTYERLA